MKTITIRNIPDEVAVVLKSLADKSDASVNTTIVRLLSDKVLPRRRKRAVNDREEPKRRIAALRHLAPFGVREVRLAERLHTLRERIARTVFRVVERDDRLAALHLEVRDSEVVVRVFGIDAQRVALPHRPPPVGGRHRRRRRNVAIGSNRDKGMLVQEIRCHGCPFRLVFHAARNSCVRFKSFFVLVKPTGTDKSFAAHTWQLAYCK